MVTFAYKNIILISQSQYLISHQQRRVNHSSCHLFYVSKLTCRLFAAGTYWFGAP